MAAPQLVAQGAYGCVYRPSIPCADHEMDYTNVVSKLMSDAEATKEMAEANRVAQIDPEGKYTLGTPIKCTPNMTPQINTSGCAAIQRVGAADWRVLQQKDGGISLAALIRTFVPISDRVSATMLRQSAHLLRGIAVMRKNTIIHGDIKPENIVVDPTTGKMRFIDFGMMRSFSSVDEQEDLNFLHFNFPPEIMFLNTPLFTRLISAPPERNEFRDLILSDAQLFGADGRPANTRINGEKLKEYFQLVEPQIMGSNDRLAAATRDRLVRSWAGAYALAEELGNNEYLFRQTVSASIDPYAYGMTMCAMFHYINFRARKTRGALATWLITRNRFDDLMGLFHSMCDDDIRQRGSDNLQALIERLDAILATLPPDDTYEEASDDLSLLSRTYFPPTDTHVHHNSPEHKLGYAELTALPSATKPHPMFDSLEVTPGYHRVLGKINKDTRILASAMPRPKDFTPSEYSLHVRDIAGGKQQRQQRQQRRRQRRSRSAKLHRRRRTYRRKR